MIQLFVGIVTIRSPIRPFVRTIASLRRQLKVSTTFRSTFRWSFIFAADRSHFLRFIIVQPELAVATWSTWTVTLGNDWWSTFGLLLRHSLKEITLLVRNFFPRDIQLLKCDSERLAYVSSASLSNRPFQRFSSGIAAANPLEYRRPFRFPMKFKSHWRFVHRRRTCPISKCFPPQVVSVSFFFPNPNTFYIHFSLSSFLSFSSPSSWFSCTFHVMVHHVIDADAYSRTVWSKYGRRPKSVRFFHTLGPQRNKQQQHHHFLRGEKKDAKPRVQQCQRDGV